MTRVLLVLAVAACAVSHPPAGMGGTYWHRLGIPETTAYPLTVTRHTPRGVAVDDPRGEIADAAVDRAFDVVEACLAALPRTMTGGDALTMGCSYKDVPAAIDRASLLVVIPPDWHVSKCSGEQLFPCHITDAGCDTKGLSREPECPCQCRHAVQQRSALIVTPNAKLLPAAIVETVTGCANPWAGVLAWCAAPL